MSESGFTRVNLLQAKWFRKMKMFATASLVATTAVTDVVAAEATAEIADREIRKGVTTNVNSKAY